MKPPLNVNFENIDFRGDQTEPIDPNDPPLVSPKSMQDIMKTMCAANFKENVNATYSGCSFEGYHYGYGGAISAIYSDSGNKNYSLTLNLFDCSFRNNASRFGGSIYLSGDDHNIRMNAKHCTFDQNAAATGGAIWAQDANVSLLDCSFVGNKCLRDDEIPSPNGGALALYNCGTELDGCLIADNTSGGKGAGVFCEISPFKTLVMKNCTVIGNTSESGDEGISVEPPKESSTLSENWIDLVCEKKEVAELVSSREMEVLRKLLEGKARKQIAVELFVTEATIKKHTSSIYEKFDVHNKTELIIKLTKQ